jgi:hypothetical protein
MGCLLGVLLILFAAVALFAVVVLPVIPGVGDTPLLMSLQGALFCPAGQTYGHDRSSYNVRPGETFLALESYCVNSDGEQVAFTGEQESRRFITSALIFVIPFVLGLFMVIGSISSAARSPRIAFATAGLPGAAGAVVGRPQVLVQRDVQTFDMSDQSREQIKQMTGFDIQRTGDGGVRIQMPGMAEPMTFNQGSDQPMVFTSSSTNVGSGTLVERLKQLEEARDQGLLSADEYDKLRKAMLDNLTGE